MHPPKKPHLPDEHSLWRTVCSRTASAAARRMAQAALLRQVAGFRPRYEFLSVLAKGGVCDIEEVWDHDLRRRLARKVLPIDCRDDRVLSCGELRQLWRFVEEATVMGRLRHPAILTITDLGSDERGRPFLTMPLVVGRTLGRILERGRSGRCLVSRRRAIGVLSDVCEAVAHAHEEGIVHRDLKPENILVGRFGETVLLDWGLAKRLGRNREPPPDGAESDDPRKPALLQTLDGDIVGTPGYISPEQAAGRIYEVSPLSDQYAVGAMLYEILTSRRPYADLIAGTTPVELILVVRERAPTPVRTLAPNAPGALTAICEKAMQRNPEHRFADMRALGRCLRVVANSAPADSCTSRRIG